MKPAELPAKTANARTEQRRTELIETASRLIFERGYHEVTVADIAAELGVGHGTFYNYFGNRRDILDAVIDTRFAAINERVIGGDGAPAHTMEEFLTAATGIAQRLYTALTEDPGLVRFVLFEAPAIDQALIDRLDAILEEMALLSRTRLDDGIRAGYLRPDLDSAVVGRSVMSLIFATALGALSEPEGLSGDDFVGALADLLRHGLGTR
ncbi:TetR/AcrR family transcriptional regulator [Nocardia wallacei]|uniref:TetR/AcrR family transcriptional regulator n=1 Tax=Nocardia wallacei TaxID=480035 RepID=UPI002456B866|nr:TetR/AcrR family transcriptional regulator [Nocardia wallacei]